MRKIAFLSRSFDEFNQWATEDKKIYAKIVTLIKDIERDPFSGLGKPEALKHDLSGFRELTGCKLVAIKKILELF